jgi:hypothetical protein
MHLHAFTVIEALLCFLAIALPFLALGVAVGYSRGLRKKRNRPIRWTDRRIKEPHTV